MTTNENSQHGQASCHVDEQKATYDEANRQANAQSFDFVEEAWKNHSKPLHEAFSTGNPQQPQPILWPAWAQGQAAGQHERTRGGDWTHFFRPLVEIENASDSEAQAEIERTLREKMFPVPQHTHVWQCTVGAGHTAVKWCTMCGKAYASYIVGDSASLQWHIVKEAED